MITVNKLILFLLCCSAIAAAQPRIRAGASIPSFALEPNDLELSRPAQPYQYFDKIGRRAALMGYESGSFEMWVWPWKPLRNFELSFLLGTSTQPILAREIVRTISVTPEATTLTYTHESFSVREHIIVPRDEPGAVLLLDVHTTSDISIVASFLPVMQPMWPAGIGGQFSYWDDEEHGYVISEGQWRAIFLCGSPGGRQMAAPPAHMFADAPLQFRIDVKPGETEGKFIPIVIAGALPDTASWKMKFDSVKTTYNRLCENAEHYYRENYGYYRDLRHSTMQVITPEREINLACEWGKVALDNLLVENPRLGFGMVAGFGLSGGGERPGFGWFFGGDAFINVLAMNSAGMFRQARDALAFTQKWQRQDNYPVRKKNAGDPPKDAGKMAHELSQSDGLCDWWNDYHYGYNHADTTPWYIVAMGDYVRTSGDVEFLKKSWKSVKQAYDWCLSKDSDGDGLMDLKGAGLGALEFGKLVGIYADVYTCGVWVQAIKEMRYMAECMGDGAVGKQADGQFRKARPQLEKKFWLDKEGYYSYGATESGEQVREKTPWSGVAMMFGLLDEARSASAIESFNSADMCTDWGVRSLSNKSGLFDPTNYNYGAVWPFIASFFNTAQFKHHYALPGYQILRANIKHAFDHALGAVPEVFSGEMNEKLGEAYHHQGFSTTGYLLPLLRGSLGLDVDAARHTVNFTPHDPSSGGFTLRNIVCGNDTLSITESLSWSANDRSAIRLDLIQTGPDTVTVTCSFPFLPIAARGSQTSEDRPDTALVVRVGGRSETPVIESCGRDVHARVSIRVKGYVRAEVFSPGNVVLFNQPESPVDRRLPEAGVGMRNRSMRYISQKTEGNSLRLLLEGRAGEEYPLESLRRFDWAIASVSGAEIRKGAITVRFEPPTGRPAGEFIRKEIVITFK